MGFDKRSTPGPGQYEARRSYKGGSHNLGESPGAFSITTHGFSVDGGSTKDSSLVDFAVSGPWISYSRGSTRDKARSREGGDLVMLNDAAGKQLLSTKPTQPRSVFGKSKRGAPSDGAAGRSPGPGVYDTTRFESVGQKKVPVATKASPSYSIGLKFPDSDKPTSPGPIYSAHAATAVGGHLDLSHSAVFPRAPRTPATKALNEPGPGMYAQPSSMGKQTFSIRASSPSPTFTRTKLSHEMPKGNPVHISNQHIADQVGKDSPGPQAHSDFTATRKGKPLLGSRGSIGVRFPKAKRMQDPGPGNGKVPSPGPGAYKVREAMGKQVLSTVQTATSAFRTTSEREKWGKPYISAAHMQVSFADWQLHDGTPDLNWRLQDVAGVDSPGPAYEVTTTKKGASMLGSSKGGTTMGTAPRDLDLKDATPGPDSYEVRRAFDRPTTVPLAAGGISGFSFSTATRPCMQQHSEWSPRGDMKLSKDIDQVSLQGVDAPGPGQYLNSKSKNLLSSVGDVNPTLKSPGGVKFGTAERKSMVNDASSSDVGPGEYNLLYSSFGKQPSSIRKTGAGYSMSRTSPEKESKVFISKLHSRAEGAGLRASPGPGSYSLGSKWALSSKKKSSPSFSFGSGPRSSFLYL